MNKCHMKFIFKYLKPYWHIWGLGIIFSVVSILLKVQYSWVMKELIDDALIKRNLNLLIKLSIIFPFLVILSVLFNYLKEYIFCYISQKLIATMRKDIFIHLLQLPYNFFLKTDPGNLINCINNDPENIQRAFTDYIISLISSGFTIIIVLSWLFFINVSLALNVLIIIPVFAIFSLFLWKKISYWGKIVTVKTAELIEHLQQIFQSMEWIKLINNKTMLTHYFSKLCDEWSKTNLKLSMNRVFSNHLWEAILTPYQGVIFFVGGVSYIQFGNPTIGTMIAFIDYLNLLIPAMLTLINEIPVIAQGSVSVKRLYQYFQKQTEISGNKYINSSSPMNIEFKHVCFKHPNTKFCIDDLSFTINQEEFVTIIGKSGAGKSTIAKLIVRLFEPDFGSILINGNDIKSYNIENLRSVIGFVQQDIYLLHGTLRDNLLLDNNNLTDNQLYKALQLAELDNLLDRLPLKLDTDIHQRGTNLSGGEKQRLAIARLILKKPLLIILDEATSSLDLYTEKCVFHNLNSLFGKTTCIAIDHKLITIHQADKILVLENGKIVENGTIDDLISTNGRLKKLLDLHQFSNCEWNNK